MKTFAMICAVVCLIGGTAFAQSVTDTVKVQIDRPVVVNGTVLPAGNFTIQILSAAGGGSAALLVRSESGREAGVLVNRLFSEDPGHAAPNVTFTRRGADYVLDEVWLSNDIGYQVLQPSKQ